MHHSVFRLSSVSEWTLSVRLLTAASATTRFLLGCPRGSLTGSAHRARGTTGDSSRKSSKYGRYGEIPVLLAGKGTISSQQQNAFRLA